MKHFNPKAILQKLKAKTMLRKKKRYHPSQLDNWRYELLDLRQKGATFNELKDFLKGNKTNVAISTISRWFNKND